MLPIYANFVRPALLLTLTIVAGISLSACSSGVPDGPAFGETTIEGNTVTEINIDAIPQEPTEIGLSEFFDGINVIRLESTQEALTMNTMAMFFAENFILLGTQTSGAARLLRFDYEGSYLNSIGGEGGGPGEHRSSYIMDVQYYEDDNVVLADWASQEPKQLFRPDGTYLGVIRMPFRLMSNINRLSENEWFSHEGTAGRPQYRRDSLKIVFFDRNGNVNRRVDRTIYPPENSTQYTPTGSSSSITYNGVHKIYFPEDHTIYRVEGQELVPDAVIRPGEKVLPYNELVDPANLVGRHSLKLLSETDRNWFLEKMVFTEVDAKEWDDQPGRWSMRFSARAELLVIDKRTGKGQAYTFADDLLHILPEAFSNQLPNWQAGFGAYLSLPAGAYLELTDQSNRIDRQSPVVREKLEVLDDLTPEDNYIIFHFPFRDEIVIN